MNGSPLTICPSQSVPRGYLFLHTVHDGQNFHNFVLHLYLSSWMANSEAYGVFFFIPGFFFLVCLFVSVVIVLEQPVILQLFFQIHMTS